MAADIFRITLAQLNPTVGDIAGNVAKAREARARAAADGADLVVLPELFIAGGLTRDAMPSVRADSRAAIETLARETADGGPAVLIGTPWDENGKLSNAVALLDGGRIAATRFKTNLPGDQQRLFTRGPAAGPVSVRGMRIGVAIGEDIWPEQTADENVVETLAETGAELIVVAAAARYIRGDGDRRLSAAVARVTESDLPLLWLNQTGGHDGEVFDGASFALNADLSIAAQLPGFVEDVTTLTWHRGDDGWQCSGPIAKLTEGDEADYAAHMLRLRDRVGKAGLNGVVFGLAAGIEPALSLGLAVDALGADKVRAVLLSGPDTRLPDEAMASAARLGVPAEIVPIAAAIEGVEKILPGPLPDDAHRDLLARVRSTLLTALANHAGALAVDASGEIAGRGGIVAALGGITPAQMVRLAALRNRWTPADALGRSGEVISPDLIARAGMEG
ncbi:nitrilase-related carbon-nitrogen hydrolase [Bradyrhizobium sp. HKCCYLR20261]|uniref:nitrilase-related carbon-nitrogen hydrolase n=1 Tax=Bradyrhizobium sp. HKCCYLR20261 TaxID=3420760 RepID=UPI003EC080C5